MSLWPPSGQFTAEIRYGIAQCTIPYNDIQLKMYIYLLLQCDPIGDGLHCLASLRVIRLTICPGTDCQNPIAEGVGVGPTRAGPAFSMGSIADNWSAFVVCTPLI